MTHFMGIDPGKSGAIVILSENHISIQLLNAENTTILEFLRNTPEQTIVVIERVHAMPIWWGGSEDKKKPDTFKPKQGIASTFKFGESYGFIKGLLFALDIKITEEVLSRVWQRKMDCLTKGNKKVSLAKAQELYPSIKVQHAYADALLIATYCKLHYSTQC